MKLITYFLQNKYNYINAVIWNDRRTLFRDCYSVLDCPDLEYLRDIVFGDNYDVDNDIYILRFNYERFREARDMVMCKQ